jgi:hypothetical protein
MDSAAKLECPKKDPATNVESRLKIDESPGMLRRFRDVQ